MLKNLLSLDTATTKRVFGLDVLRAIAILIVVDAHATIALKEYYPGAFIHHLLPDGVELFFVLSGFLIGGILIRSYEKQKQFDRSLLFNFWTRRWFRTLPAYYFVLLGLISFALVRAWRSGLHHTLPSKGILIKYFFFLQNFASFVPDFFPETWSLAIEEWSYISLPLLLWLMHGLLSTRWSRQRIVLTTILFIIVATNLYRVFNAIRIPITEGELGYRGIVVTRLDAISYGVLAAYAKHYFPVLWTNRTVQQRLGLIGLLMTVLTSFSASIIIIKYYYQAGLFPAYTFYKRTFYFPFIGLSMALFMPYMDSWRNATGLWGRFGIGRAITHISLISYSMYLLNLTPIMINGIERIPTSSLTVAWLKVGLFWVIVLISSTLLYKFFEKPVTELRERLSAKEPTEIKERESERVKE